MRRDGFFRLRKIGIPSHLRLRIPARYDAGFCRGGPAGRMGRRNWKFVTYALIRRSQHLGINAVWLLAFGTRSAPGVGAKRFAPSS